MAVALTNNAHNMIERAIDVAIRVGNVEDSDLVARPLFDASFVVCCAPDAAKTLPAHPRDLDPRRCIGILPEARHSPDRWLLRTPFAYVECRGESSVTLHGHYLHRIARIDGRLAIELKRVNLVNASTRLPAVQLFI